MKKFIWVIMLTVTVMLATSCEEGNNTSSNQATASYLESEGTSTHINRAAMDMSDHAGGLKSGVSTDVYNARVVTKALRKNRNPQVAIVALLMTYIFDYDNETKKKKREPRP